MALDSEEQIPGYRLRLFLSVDLVGSTAFKAGEGSKPSEGKTSQPRWVQTIRDFYVQFPQILRERYESSNPGTLAPCPRIWKTIGDEIVFCCRIENLRHLCSCVGSFLSALDAYGLVLEKKGSHLDVKGTGWTAAFPAPNVTVALQERSLTIDQFDENFEQNADKKPESVDFLGNAIDCGFRISSRSASDRCAIALELAWLLAIASVQNLFTHRFNYHDRHVFKGVLRERPYPVFSIDTERSAKKRVLRDHERKLTGLQKIEALDVQTFLDAFMGEEDVERPVLPDDEGLESANMPKSYLDFCDSWLRDAADLRYQKKQEEEGEKPANAGDNADLPELVVRGLDTLAESVRIDTKTLNS